MLSSLLLGLLGFPLRIRQPIRQYAIFEEFKGSRVRRRAQNVHVAKIDDELRSGPKLTGQKFCSVDVGEDDVIRRRLFSAERPSLPLSQSKSVMTSRSQISNAIEARNDEPRKLV
jgi:hypothetical protein